MAQITINLDDETLARVESETRAAGVSQSQWIEEAIRLRMNSEWPVSVRELAGAWPDFPEVEDLRREYKSDAPREEL